MFGIGWTELVIVLLVVLVFVGPKHLPAMLRRVGRLMADLQSASRELRNQIDIEASDMESPSRIARRVGRDLSRDLMGSPPSPYAEAERERVAAAEPGGDEGGHELPPVEVVGRVGGEPQTTAPEVDGDGEGEPGPEETP